MVISCRTLLRLQPEREHRFLLPRAQAETLVKTAAGHTRLVTYDRDRPVAYSRTTYFDTADRTYYRSSLQGPVSKRLRVREYAGAIDTDHDPVFTGGCFLEVKQSTGSAREKRRAAVDPADMAAVLAAQGLHPCLTTWYRRVTLIDAEGRIRITMDEGITYGMPGPFGRDGEPVPPLEVVKYGPSRVIELKLIGPPPRWIEAAVTGLVEDHEYSKFRMGMRALDEEKTDVGRRTRPIQIPPAPPDGDT